MSLLFSTPGALSLIWKVSCDPEIVVVLFFGSIIIIVQISSKVLLMRKLVSFVAYRYSFPTHSDRSRCGVPWLVMYRVIFPIHSLDDRCSFYYPKEALLRGVFVLGKMRADRKKIKIRNAYYD